ncbi:glycosyltransferase [Lutibacter sp. TH_r2]|uniref:glycosyltransferase family 4 protein n=1 Tax=Lutibacter sp. TH_r2 TaxID=3082083 RepID=UPI002953092A|nr:glycosyltransferase [Lutibacter sp. TH_r2]MDV7187455.1 glycosyltransferase [Lutibacter sp. TH_r2]
MNGIRLTQIPSFDITSLKKSVKALLVIPKILWNIFKAMKRADHIHVRCPGNIGLLGALVQILFPSKPKTVKYAGNWDPKSKQPISYRFQKWILSNTFLTKNCKVLVYGNWPNQSKNIIPFFTASYSEHEIEDVEIRTMNRHPELDSGSHGQKSRISNQVENGDNNRHNESSEAISSTKQIVTSQTSQNDENNNRSLLDTESHQSILKFLFVGGLTPGKQPLLSVKVVHQLLKKGIQAQLNIYGEGKERNEIERFIVKNNLQNRMFLHGNQSEQIVKAAYKKAHFLLFISKSEGWPKVVAEAMFWGCVPLTSNVSCVNEMIGDGSRGTLVEPDIKEIVNGLESYLNTKGKYKMHAQNAMDWSRQYTLEKFEEEIEKLLSPLERG